MINMFISSLNDGVKSAWDADHLSPSTTLRRVHCYSATAKLQAGLDIHEGLSAQKYIDEIVRPHFEPHVDNHALTNNTVLIGGGEKPPAESISQGVLANATSFLLSAKNPDIFIVNLWSIVSRNINSMNPLP